VSDATRYDPSAQRPRSCSLQRSLQKGRHAGSTAWRRQNTQSGSGTVAILWQDGAARRRRQLGTEARSSSRRGRAIARRHAIARRRVRCAAIDELDAVRRVRRRSDATSRSET
jgi:hypothetical protein